MAKSKKTSNRGGKREGAGRPKGSGLYGCCSAPVRVPIHLSNWVREMCVTRIGFEREKKKFDVLFVDKKHVDDIQRTVDKLKRKEARENSKK